MAHPLCAPQKVYMKAGFRSNGSSWRWEPLLVQSSDAEDTMTGSLQFCALASNLMCFLI